MDKGVPKSTKGQRSLFALPASPLGITTLTVQSALNSLLSARLRAHLWGRQYCMFEILQKHASFISPQCKQSLNRHPDMLHTQITKSPLMGCNHACPTYCTVLYLWSIKTWYVTNNLDKKHIYWQRYATDSFWRPHSLSFLCCCNIRERKKEPPTQTLLTKNQT